jgi:cellulase
MFFPLVLLSITIATHVAAHGRLTNITTSSGEVYGGWNPEYAYAPEPPPPLAAWSASNLGNVFVPPPRFSDPDIICHRDATPGALHINTTAGDTLTLQWNEWPTSHVGPVMSYLAACNGSCSYVDKTKLEWVKIDQLGWLNSSGWDDLMLGGTWATNVLIANDFRWQVQVPEGLTKGEYVLRHEIIALHVAEGLGGAQAYPQCVNLKVREGGEKKIEGGVLATELYGMRDEGIFVDVHQNIEGYEIPGPEVWNWAVGVMQPNMRRL